MHNVWFINHAISEGNHHVAAVCETSLVPSVPSSFVSVPGFQVVRIDDGGSIRKHGECLYIKDSFKVSFSCCDFSQCGNCFLA